MSLSSPHSAFPPFRAVSESGCHLLLPNKLRYAPQSRGYRPPDPCCSPWRWSVVNVLEALSGTHTCPWRPSYPHLPLASVVPGRCFSPSLRSDCPREGRGRLSLNCECLVTVCGACNLVESPAFTLVSIVWSQFPTICHSRPLGVADSSRALPAPPVVFYLTSCP